MVSWAELSVLRANRDATYTKPFCRLLVLPEGEALTEGL